LFRTYAIPHQIILSKVDRILLPKNRKSAGKVGVSASNMARLKQVLRDLQPLVQPDHEARTEGPGALGEILTCSTEVHANRKQTTLGVSAIRWAILVAAGYDAGATLAASPAKAIQTGRTSMHNPIIVEPLVTA
jgi:GTP-binding protein